MYPARQLRQLILAAAAAASLSPLIMATAQTAVPGGPPVRVSEMQLQPTPEDVGDSLMSHQRYQAAIEAYGRAPDDSARIWNKRGIANQLMLNGSAAEQCYRKALKLDGRSAAAVNNLGSIYMAQRNYSKAVREYRKAVKLDPRAALFRKNLGTALLAQRKYKKGWDEYQAALAIDPQIFDHSSSIRIDNPSTIQDRGAMNFYMAKSCAKAGMTNRAVSYLRMALNEGFTTPKKILADAELSMLRTEPEFQKLMESQGVYLTDPNARGAVRQ